MSYYDVYIGYADGDFHREGGDRNYNAPASLADPPQDMQHSAESS